MQKPVLVQEESGWGVCLVTNCSFQLFLLPRQEKRSPKIILSLFQRVRNLFLLPLHSPWGERHLCQQVHPSLG